MLEQSLEAARQGRQAALDELLELLSIPSVSALPDHDGDTRRACAWTADRLRRMGMKVEVAEVPGGRHPVISAEWLGRPGKPTLSTYYLLIADGEFTAPGLPNLLTGLRGLLYTEIVAQGAAADLHSGIFGGAVPNPLNTLAHVISALKGRDGRITIPGFYDDLVPPTAEEVELWRRVKDENTIRSLAGVRALEGEEGFSAVERTWARPTLDVHGIVGGFVGEGYKTVIPGRAK